MPSTGCPAACSQRAEARSQAFGSTNGSPGPVHGAELAGRQHARAPRRWRPRWRRAGAPPGRPGAGAERQRPCGAGPVRACRSGAVEPQRDHVPSGATRRVRRTGGSSRSVRASSSAVDRGSRAVAARSTAPSTSAAVAAYACTRSWTRSAVSSSSASAPRRRIRRAGPRPHAVRRRPGRGREQPLDRRVGGVGIVAARVWRRDRRHERAARRRARSNPSRSARDATGTSRAIAATSGAAGSGSRSRSSGAAAAISVRVRAADAAASSSGSRSSSSSTSRARAPLVRRPVREPRRPRAEASHRARGAAASASGTRYRGSRSTRSTSARSMSSVMPPRYGRTRFAGGRIMPDVWWRPCTATPTSRPPPGSWESRRVPPCSWRCSTAGRCPRPSSPRSPA